jgi:FkbM family methyltransferase
MGRGDITFDIGAHLGNRTKVFARLSRMVIAIEPQESCMRALKTQLGANPKVTLIKKALGAREGSAEIMVSNAAGISSMSPTWVAAVRESGRFAEYAWEQKQVVEVTTLDKLIRQFGMPAFIKIDVEGFEFEVLSGLSQRVKALSFEFVPECLDAAFRCVQHLASLGEVNFNYSLGESAKLELKSWVSREEITTLLSEYAEKLVKRHRGPETYRDLDTFGDVYARFVS